MNTEVTKNEGENALEIIQNAQNELQNSIQKSTFADSSSGMLMEAVYTPFLIDFIAILSAIGPDPPLVSVEMPRENFKVLKTPGSFQGCLYQVTACTRDAYSVAHHSMNTIRSSLKDFPDYFISIFEILAQRNINENMQKELSVFLEQIKNDTDKCEKAASKAHDSIVLVLALLTELIQATTAVKSIQSKETKELQKRKNVLMSEKESRATANKLLEKEAEEANQRKSEARIDYKKQIQSNDLTKTILLNTVAEGVTAYVNPASNKQLFSLGVEVAKRTFETVIESKQLNQMISKSIDLMEYATTIKLIQTLENIIPTLNEEISDEKVNENIANLKSFENCNTATSAESVAVVNKAKELCEFLEKNGHNLSEDSIKMELASIKISVSNCVETSKNVVEEQKKQSEEKRKAHISFRDQLIKNDTEKTKISYQFYEKESENANQIRESKMKNAEELQKIICELKNIEINTDDLTGCIAYIRNALAYLSMVQQNWSKLEQFFQQIKCDIENDLCRNVDLFSRHVENNISQKNMAKAALKATAYCIQITNCAELYSLTSENFIMPVINGVSGRFALTPEQAKKKQKEIEIKLDALKKNFVENIYKKEKELNDNVNHQIFEFSQKLKEVNGEEESYFQSLKNKLFNLLNY